MIPAQGRAYMSSSASSIRPPLSQVVTLLTSLAFMGLENACSSSPSGEGPGSAGGGPLVEGAHELENGKGGASETATPGPIAGDDAPPYDAEPYDFGAPKLESLPRPVLESHADWVELYYRAFEIAMAKVQQGTPENGFVSYYMDEAFSANIFQWDTTFMMMFARYSNNQLPSVVSLENFYQAQDETGWICRELREADGRPFLWEKGAPLLGDCSVNPPLFAWAEWQDYQVRGDASRFTKMVGGKTVLQVLVDYYGWIKAHRRRENGLYWTTPWASGMDDTPRLVSSGNAVPFNEVWGDDGPVAELVCAHLDSSWIDMSAQQAQNAYYIAKIAEVVGDVALQEQLEAEHAELRDLINAKMWDELDGFYYDLSPADTFDKVKTPASFWPLIAAVSGPDQVKRIIDEHLTNPAEFWTQHHLPTVAANEPNYRSDGGYWGGAIWAPTTYATIKGVEAQGYGDLAHELAKNHIEQLALVYQQTGTLHENYQPETPLPGIHARNDFVGWTGLGPISCLIENVLGIVVDAPDDSLHWTLRLTEKHGIQNLKFGNNKVTLEAAARADAAAGARLTITTNSPFRLVVTIGTQEFTEVVPKGLSTFHWGG